LMRHAYADVLIAAVCLRVILCSSVDHLYLGLRYVLIRFVLAVTFAHRRQVFVLDRVCLKAITVLRHELLRSFKELGVLAADDNLAH